MITLVSFVSFGQQKFIKYFMGDNYKTYKNLLVKVDTTKERPSHTFYKKSPISSFDNNNILYPNKEYTFTTDMGKLQDRVFKVDSIYDGNSYDEKIFRLIDVNINDTIYYKYRTTAEWDYCLLSEPIKLNELDFKKEIEKEVDDFTKEVRFMTPLNNQVGSLWKYVKNGKTTYYLSMEIESSGIYRGNGVYVLFTDGTKWSRPNEKVDVKYRSGFQNSVFIPLTTTDLQIFKTKTIRKYRLYIHDQEVDIVDADKFKIYTSLITKL
jgi:hypothetical protein